MNFTVKHRAPDGTETLYACDTVTVIGGPNCSPAVYYVAGDPEAPAPKDMYSEGIFLDREMDCHAPTEPVTFTSRHIIQFGGEETVDRRARKGGKVWVMDAHGATVASYDL